MPSVAVGVDIFMSPVCATSAATKATVPLAISNNAEFLLAAVLIDITVDGDAGIRSEVERGGVVEGDAERGIRRGLQHVVQEDVVLRLERRRGIVAGDGRGAGQGGDISDRLVVGRLRAGGCRRCGRGLQQPVRRFIGLRLHRAVRLSQSLVSERRYVASALTMPPSIRSASHVTSESRCFNTMPTLQLPRRYLNVVRTIGDSAG